MAAAAEAAPDKRPSSWRPRKTVHDMVEEAKTRIQNLSIGQLQAELAAGGIQLLDIRDVKPILVLRSEELLRQSAARLLSADRRVTSPRRRGVKRITAR